MPGFWFDISISFNVDEHTPYKGRQYIATASHSPHIKQHDKILILIDSQSGIKAIENKNRPNQTKLINQILKSTQQLNTLGKQI